LHGYYSYNVLLSVFNPNPLNQHFSNFILLQHTLINTGFGRGTPTSQKPTCHKLSNGSDVTYGRFCQNIKLSQHTSASSAAHSLGNPALNSGS